MSDKVLYQCPACGDVWFTDPVPHPKCWCKGHKEEPKAMVHVWPAPSEWISVEEQCELPEEWRGIVWQQEPGSMGRWTIGRWILNRWVSDRYIPLRCVTHYQPGPSAPEEASHD